MSRPGIFQIGRVDHDIYGQTVIRGWGLSACADRCACHYHPTNGHLYIAEDQRTGSLGLRSFTEHACDCCQPWTAAELAQIVRDLRHIDALETTTDADTDGAAAA